MQFPLDNCRAWLEGGGSTGIFKSKPEDFIVEERMDEDFSGEGEHLYLKVRKTNQNTQWVAEQLARLAGIPAKDVGYAGRKDRFAVTTQWFSLLSKDSIEDISSIEGCELLDSQRHICKLRLGDHQANYFRISVRELSGNSELRDRSLANIQAHGFPNYFGVQRFGYDGGNLEKGWDALLNGRRLRGRQSGMYLSALRSWVFNQVLDRHMREGNWQAICSGSPDWTGPLWGRGRNAPGPLETAVESRVVDENAELCHHLEFGGLKQERRGLIARPRDFRVLEHGEALLTLEFELSRGQFATELLAEIVAQVAF